jgi:hypothetical protein
VDISDVVAGYNGGAREKNAGNELATLTLQKNRMWNLLVGIGVVHHRSY